jgi:hypothetical protein
MLLGEACVEEHQSQVEKVNRHGYFVVGNNMFPSFCHAFRPMDIIKNDE